jgi:hypothetical protein
LPLGLTPPRPALSANAIGLLLLGLLLQLPSSAWAAEIRPAALGLRYGSTLDLYGEPVDAERTDLFAIFPLRWQGRWGNEWVWRTGLELNLGRLAADNEVNVAALGPTLIVQKGDSRFALEAGIQLTRLSGSVIGPRDLGGRTHFTSHITLLWQFSEHWLGGYRLQHISNASTRDVNPGLNTQMLELRYQL